MQNDEKMVCPNCKVEMNFHAMKIDYTQTTNKPESVNHEFGGILEEFRSCPKCGMTDTREEKKAA
ncbi:MAG: hypothetical protein MOB07_23455 [Acidobacteria bacterium]|nr:hypothetical protein [Acidobacteriota bacterium]